MSINCLKIDNVLLLSHSFETVQLGASVGGVDLVGEQTILFFLSHTCFFVSFTETSALSSNASKNLLNPTSTLKVHNLYAYTYVAS